MQSREDLHKLVDSLPEGAIDAAHRLLSTLQVWPPRPPIDREKKIMMTEVRTPTGTKAGFSRWDGDTYVVGTYRHVGGHELEIVESIRVHGEHLIYKHEMTGPDGRSVTLDLDATERHYWQQCREY